MHLLKFFNVVFDLYRFLKLQVEVKEQDEQLLSSQEKIKQDLLVQSRKF